MRQRSKAIFCSLALAGVLAAGCADGDEDVTAEGAASTVESVVGSAATRASAAGQDVLASLHTEAERLMDDVRSSDTGKADTARKQLLDRCRNTLEQLRKDASPQADRVEKLCDAIRDAKTDTDWSGVESELAALGGGSSGTGTSGSGASATSATSMPSQTTRTTATSTASSTASTTK